MIRYTRMRVMMGEYNMMGSGYERKTGGILYSESGIENAIVGNIPPSSFLSAEEYGDDSDIQDLVDILLKKPCGVNEGSIK